MARLRDLQLAVCMSVQRAEICGNMLNWKCCSEGVGGFEKRVWHARACSPLDLQLGSECRVLEDDIAGEGFEGGALAHGDARRMSEG